LIPDFFYVHTFDTRFQYANKAAAEYFGMAREQLLGRRLEDVDHDAEQGRFFAEVCREVMRDGRPRITDALPYTRRDGTKGFLRQHDFPFIDARTGEPMLLGISRDVTVERELQAEQARRAVLEREMEIAHQIQSNLRPSAEPVLVGSTLSIAGSSEPAAYAGGDFYDWFTTKDGRVIVCIGDVTGHGVGPAMLAAECRAYARVLLEQFELPKALERLSSLLEEDLADGRFITFAAAAIDPKTYTAEVLSAGHGPLLVLRGAGASVESLGAQMPPLGVTIGAPEEPTMVKLERGDALVLVSDGVFEAGNDSGATMGLDHMLARLRAGKTADAREIVRLLLEEAKRHSGSAGLRDDATVVVAERG
ncbi:MAG: SpoIIE family protein phosphatase, partial [Phycisphaerales bacterium]|nr:SpoIIE family protein phosphatase [Phycisphaerales bacterium]